VPTARFGLSAAQGRVKAAFAGGRNSGYQFRKSILQFQPARINPSRTISPQEPKALQSLPPPDDRASAGMASSTNSCGEPSIENNHEAEGICAAPNSSAISAKHRSAVHN
jgi:hypothetical protein